MYLSCLRIFTLRFCSQIYDTQGISQCDSHYIHNVFSKSLITTHSVFLFRLEGEGFSCYRWQSERMLGGSERDFDKTDLYETNQQQRHFNE